MLLTGDIFYFTGSQANFRGRWTPNTADGSVRQFFEQFYSETNSWDLWFDGRYARRQGVYQNPCACFYLVAASSMTTSQLKRTKRCSSLISKRS